MNTSQLKKFAQEARRKLLEQVGAKLNFVLTTDSAELREKTEQLKQLRTELSRTTKEQLIEKVAYTWFNRLMALRFMDANDYQPLGIRIITPKDGYTIPELLDEAKRGNIPEELKVNRQKIFDLLDGKITSTNPQNEAYKELLIAACNHLNTTFPFLFEKINDFTELLLPDDLTSDFSIVKDIRDGMLIEDCKNVEIFGWLYQFYISEKKDEVFASKTKVKKEDIPAATQLFTPKWIVEYMVQNTLGKLWLQNHPKSRLREYMPYFVKSASLESEEYLKINSPEEIKFLDPACGSGHILVYAFNLLTKIYEEEGYNTSEIPQLIIENNLYGFEIDERAAQLSALALMMKTREYQRKVFQSNIHPNIQLFKDLSVTEIEIYELLEYFQIRITDEFKHDLIQEQEATNIGSLYLPHTNKKELSSIRDTLIQGLSNQDIFQRNKIDAVVTAINQLLWLSNKFHCCVTNPPYMSDGSFNKELSHFINANFPDSKYDLMACFIESGLALLFPKGFLGMINQHSWMFLSSFERLRMKIIDNVYIDSLLHLGARTFPEIGGEVVQNVSFVTWNESINAKGTFYRLVDFNTSSQKQEKTLEAISTQGCEWSYTANQQDFKKIKCNPISYWLTERAFDIFDSSDSIENIANPRQGMATSDVTRFIRFWFEVNYNKIGFTLKSRNEAKASKKKWFPHNKGGGVQKWFGNNYYVVNWEDDGKEVLAYAAKLYGSPTRTIKNINYYFLPSVTWGMIGTGLFTCRISDGGFTFDVGGPSAFPELSKLNFIAGYLNSNICFYFLKAVNPTLNFNSGDISRLPFKEIEDIQFSISISELVESCKGICKTNFDSFEYSWDFQSDELLHHHRNGEFDIEETYGLYQQYWKIKFLKLHQIEEEINWKFITQYGLHDELKQNVSLENVTILQDILVKKSLDNLNNALIRDQETNAVTNYSKIDLP